MNAAHSVIGKDRIVDQLRELALPRDRPLMVHASLRKIGPIEGGAEGLLDALLAYLGDRGTLLMPLGADESTPFDARHTPAAKDIGVLAEVFRRRAGTQVNDHAAGRFGACGPLSHELLEPIPLHDYHGPGSLLERFTALNGTVLRLGADADTVTLTHWAEYLANMPNKRRVRRRYFRADVGEQWIESLDDNDGIVTWGEGDYFTQIWLDFVTAGAAHTGQLGACEAQWFTAKRYVAFAVEWLESTFGDTQL